MMVQVPLIVDVESGVNDYLDRDGSRTPIQFHISNDRDLHPIDAQVVQAATKWKRMALRQFGMQPGEGLLHRHARRPQGLLPRPRPQRLRRPVGLGAGDHGRGAQPRVPDARRSSDLEGAQGRRGASARRVPGARRRPLPAAARGARRSSTPRTSSTRTRTCRASSARRRSSRSTPRSSSTASAGRSRTATRTRCAPPTTTTGSTETRLGGRPADARPERRHPGLEPGHASAATS